MGAGGGTSDSLGSLGFRPLGFGVGFEVEGDGTTPLAAEAPEPNFSLSVGTAEFAEGAATGVDPLRVDVAELWSVGGGGGGATG